MSHVLYSAHFVLFILLQVEVSIKSRVVTVKGPRGTLVKSFRHMDLEIVKVGKNKLRVDVWFANRKQLACVKTICSHIENLFNGVLYVSKMLVRLLKELRPDLTGIPV